MSAAILSRSTPVRLASVICLAFVLAACTGNRFRADSLPSAPVGQVQGQTLPPPGQQTAQGTYAPGTFGQGQFPQSGQGQFGQTAQGVTGTTQTGQPGQFGAQTGISGQTAPQGQTAAAGQNTLTQFTPPPTALDAAEPGQLSGAWTISDATGSCQLFLTNTTWTGGLRASTRGCTSPELQKVSAWNTNDKEIILKDLDSQEIARLARTAQTQYQGVLASGGGVAFFR